MTKYTHLFQPLKVGKTEIKNRIFMPPISTNLANKGYVTDNTDTILVTIDNKDVKKVAVTMFPTVNVIKEASEWGADLLIVHELLH